MAFEDIRGFVDSIRLRGNEQPCIARIAEDCLGVTTNGAGICGNCAGYF